ncbi:MAG: hypothetical protein D8M51_11810 [Ignavibacteriae bacterium]|nr:hypothetical protein [Ignavibacteriota bacterium]
MVSKTLITIKKNHRPESDKKYNRTTITILYKSLSSQRQIKVSRRLKYFHRNKKIAVRKSSIRILIRIFF